MAPLILTGFLALPLIEIAVFIKVGGLIGVWPTIGLTLLSTVLGVWLMRWQGLTILIRAREAITRQEPPVDEMLDGLCILLAGALLIVPGFVTDLLGLLLFVPWIRRHARRRIWGAFERQERRSRGRVIEVDYTVVEEERIEERRPDDRPRMNGSARRDPEAGGRA